MTLVADFIRASRLPGQSCEVSDALSGFYLSVSDNRMVVVLIDYSEELKAAFRANVTDSLAILFWEWVRPQQWPFAHMCLTHP